MTACFRFVGTYRLPDVSCGDESADGGRPVSRNIGRRELGVPPVIAISRLNNAIKATITASS